MSTPYVDISFITVNYNGIQHTADLLKSIFTKNFSFSYEVIVIDNGSNSNEFEALRIKYPEIQGKYHTKNLGFAGGNNLGIDLAHGEYLYFLNNDTLLPEEADDQLAAMFDFCRHHPQVGGLSPKIMYNSPSDLIQFAGSTPLSMITLRNKQIGYKEQDRGQYNTLQEIPYMHGAAMFVPRRVIEHVGSMPELYFLYYEELDWSCQISTSYKLYYYPDAYIYHKESVSTGIDSPLKTFYLTRNRLLFAFRNRRGTTRVLSIFYLMTIASPLKMLKFIVQGKWQQVVSVWSGFLSGISLIRANS
ncbi:glycosyltransferase family 2 protein [Sphingobacterium corticibacterium]|uniref:Glycosyltransferase family 2 protein n=1 Tax=Sphingobacterium corticibacterium TaxID=2484746 RepID=A0A4Q6XSC0_9SPHI|nr:glycosyltransferase family 2 protein [Sphingobacterium corticibacterium]RZF59437.1 glycosyltransferase family 2 protein [Sphingobacterium corticibacterium]